MKSTGLWMSIFLKVAAGAFVLLAGVYLLRGAVLADALREAGIWSVISATIFTGVRFRNARRCRLCEMLGAPK